MTGHPGASEHPVANPVDALQLLRHCGFGARRLYNLRGDTTTLHYRRLWRGMSDVVLVYAEDDAEAYRADDSLAGNNPFEMACRPDLLQEAVGTVTEVVAAVTTWPVPGALSSYFSTSAPVVQPGARHAAD